MDCSSVVPVKRKADEDAIRCICGFDYDDGFSIACDNCSRWCHAACFGIVDADVPEEWKCWICQPRLVDKDAAERLQRSRINRLRDVDKQRRRLSPGIERKQRRPSTISEPQKRRRPPSITTPTQDDDLHIDIDEPSTHAYVPITADIVHPDAREKLRRHAHNWRGVSAISTDDHPATPIYLSDSSLTPTTTLKQIPSTVLAHPFSNPDVRPPAYAVHTAAPVPSHHFIAPYTSSITPSSSYLADPLNAYAHLGMPKPFVHLIGPPLDLALDARIAGDSARFVRSGCKPNAVLRPVLCPPKDNSNTSTDSLSFGVFALRDLKPNEEVVLGWEWDDGNAVHSLPALVQAPHTFNHPSPSDSPHQIQRLRHQMSNILHALSSTFTTCACGAKARDCVINQMSAFVDGHSLYSPDHLDLGPLVGKRRGFRTREKLPFSSGMGGVEMCSDEEEAYRDRKGKGKARPNGLLHDDDDNRLVFARSTLLPTSGISIAPPRMQRAVSHSSSDNNNSPLPLPEPDPPDQQRHSSPPLTEDRMPPKMRKRWNRQLRLQKKEEPSQSPAASIISLGSTESGDHNDVALGIRMDEDNPHHVMPPPPPPLPSTSSDLPNLHSFGCTVTVISPTVDLPHPSLISSSTTDLTQSPFQSWAPFERKEAPTEDASKKMDVVESVPIPFDTSSPSPHSPPVSLSPRSRSRTRSRSPPPHSSPTSTAITTPPSPREPKLPDVPPPIQESPESPPPHIDIDAPSPRMPIVIDDYDDDGDDVMKIDGMHPRAPSPPRAQSTPIPDPTTPASPQQLQSSPLSSPPPAVPSDVDHDEPTPRKPTTIPSRPPTPPPQQTTPAPEDLTPTATPTSTHEQLTSEPAPALPPPSPSPSPSSPPPQPSKVKLSLKDFAARKKRLREERGAGSSSVNTSADASPMVGGMKSLQASPKPPSDQLPPWAAPTPAAAASAAWESTDNMSPNLPWWIRTPLLSVVGTDPPPKDIGISVQTTTKVPDGSWTPFRKIDPQLGQPRPMSKEEPVLNSLGPSTPIPVSTSLPIKLRSEMRPTLGSTRSAKEQDNLLKKKEQELVAIQNRNRAREFDQLVRRDREMREEREKQLKSDAVVRSALVVNGTTPEPPPQEDGEIMAQTHTPVPSTPLQPPTSFFTSSTPVSSSTVTPSPLIIPSLAPVSTSIPAVVSIPTAPRAHRKFTGSYSNTPTGPRFFRSIELPKGPPPPKGPSALRDSMNITRRPVPSQTECSHPYPPPPPNTSPPPQPPPPPRTSLPSPTPTSLPSVQLSIPFSQSWDTSMSMSQKSTPQAPRAFSRSFTNGNSHTGNNSRVSSPSSRASPTPSNGSTTPSANPPYSLSPPLPPISTKSHTLSRTTSTPTTPTASSTPTTTTLLNPSVAGLPSRPPAPVGLGLGHHLSSSHPMSMLGTSMAMGGVAKRSGTEKPRFTRRTSEDRERDRDRDRDRDLSRDRDWDRDRFDRDRDRDRDNRERERGGDRERDREREYRDRVWPRHASSPSSHQEWDSWDR